MLVISRRKGQRVSIGDDIELVVTEVHRSSVKLGIRAPRGLTVLRGEVHDSIEEANRAAASTSVDGIVEPPPGAPRLAPIEVSVLRPRSGKVPTDSSS
jgi:carbon storage regulator